MNKKKKTKYLTCKECGKKDKTVKRRLCGYSRELYNEDVIEVICDDCEYEHLLDI